MRFIRVFLICVLSTVLGIVYARELPRVKSWLLTEIQVVSKKKSPVEIHAKRLNFSVFPLGIELLDVEVKPNAPLNAMLAPGRINMVGIYLHMPSAAAGRFEIGAARIEYPRFSLVLRPPKEERPKSPAQSVDIPWNDLIKFPLKRVEISHAEITGKIEGPDLAFQLKDFGLNFDKGTDAVLLEIFAPAMTVKKIAVDGSARDFGLSTRIIAEKNALEMSALKFTHRATTLIARGVARGDITHFQWSVVNGRSVARADLTELRETARIFFPQLNLPDVSGRLTLELLARHQRGHEPLLGAQVETRDLRIDKFKIGGIQAGLKYAAGILRADEIKISTGSGEGHLQNVDVHLDKDYKFSSRVIVDHMELQRLLADLGVGDIPVHFDFNARIPCEGTLVPALKVMCAGEIHGNDLRVFTKPENKTIVALDKIEATSTLTIDKEKIVFPHGIIALGSSQGEVQGLVDFAKGFQFKFSTPALDFKNVKSLADLKYEGTVALNGSTSGDGHSGIIDTDLTGKDFWFEDYLAGNTTMHLRYEKSYIHLTDIRGETGNTRFKGQAHIKVSNTPPGSAGISAQLDLPTLSLEDLTRVFSRKVILPFQASGTGSATLELNGPFSLSELTYRLRSGVGSGVVAGEAFKDLHYNVHAVKGHVFADDVQIKKGDGLLVMNGDVQSSGKMNLTVSGRGLHVSDFDYARAKAPSLDGKVSLDMELKEHILHPHVVIKSAVSQTTINQKPLEDSNLTLTVSPDSWKIAAQIFNESLRLDVTYPLQEGNPFSLDLSANRWDFSNMLSVVGGTFRHDYETYLTGRVKLANPHGGMLESTGEMRIDQLYIRHGISEMKNPKPVVVRFDGGQINIENMQFEGDATQLKVTGGRSKKDILNLNVNGRVDLALLTFLTPFFKDMSGQLSLSTQIGGTLDRPDLLGSAFITKGFFKLEALPHAFEDISADFLFSQSHALLNRFNGHFAGGQLTAGGSIGFRGLNDIPVELNGDVQHATLQIPEGLTTRGNAHFVITGTWFPYLLKLDYSIDDGLYVKNFVDESQDNLVRRSRYLPKVILQKEFSPIDMDLYAHFSKGVAVKNSLVESDVRGELQIKGDPKHPILKGEIEAVPNGKIFFHETPFNITTARLRFGGGADNNASVYSLATTRVRDWDISLLVQGTAQKPDIILSSSPPLSEQSIVSLLALGVTDEVESSTAAPVTQNQSNTNENQTAKTYQAGSLLLSENPLQNELKRKLGVNVRLSQTVDDTHNVVMPQVVAEKQWTPQISTTVSRTLGDRVTNDINVEYKLNRHFSILGSYEGRDFDSLAPMSTKSQQQNNISQDIFGLDLQYQVEFK